MRSLNFCSIDWFKSKIAKTINHHNVSDIKLFGSRITGIYRDDSDLDVFILDNNLHGDDMSELINITIKGIVCEIRYVSPLLFESFNMRLINV